MKYTAAGQSPGAQHNQLERPFPVNGSFHRWMGQNRLHLRCKQKSSLTEGIEQGFDPDAVSGQEQSPSVLLPDRKGKNTVELFDTVLPPPCITVKHYLCIGMPMKAVPQPQQLPAQFFGIIKLAVVDQSVGLALQLQGHWLPSALRIDHRKTAVQQRTCSILKITGIIRPSALHGQQHFLPCLRICPQIQQACNGAHDPSHPFRSPILCNTGKNLHGISRNRAYCLR